MECAGKLIKIVVWVMRIFWQIWIHPEGACLLIVMSQISLMIDYNLFKKALSKIKGLRKAPGLNLNQISRNKIAFKIGI